ncbi:hypothetical protein QN369_26020, partial [Pseudomonas sp. CCI1.4]|nr:hypothetical protein [Pseudomonas sp. CCI1.4]
LSDGSFRFFFVGRAQDWGGQLFSGSTLKQLAGVDVQNYVMFLVIPGVEVELMVVRELFELGRRGVVHFGGVEIYFL